jgi:hypothetical protein
VALMHKLGLYTVRIFDKRLFNWIDMKVNEKIVASVGSAKA